MSTPEAQGGPSRQTPAAWWALATRAESGPERSAEECPEPHTEAEVGHWVAVAEERSAEERPEPHTEAEVGHWVAVAEVEEPSGPERSPEDDGPPLPHSSTLAGRSRLQLQEPYTAVGHWVAVAEPSGPERSARWPEPLRPLLLAREAGHLVAEAEEPSGSGPLGG